MLKYLTIPYWSISRVSQMANTPHNRWLMIMYSYTFKKSFTSLFRNKVKENHKEFNKTRRKKENAVTKQYVY